MVGGHDRSAVRRPPCWPDAACAGRCAAVPGAGLRHAATVLSQGRAADPDATTLPPDHAGRRHRHCQALVPGAWRAWLHRLFKLLRPLPAATATATAAAISPRALWPGCVRVRAGTGGSTPGDQAAARRHDGDGDAARCCCDSRVAAAAAGWRRRRRRRRPGRGGGGGPSRSTAGTSVTRRRAARQPTPLRQRQRQRRHDNNTSQCRRRRRRRWSQRYRSAAHR
jgi:hypothetical protein